MKRTLRYLRIAFSATCLIACVLLVVLWVRSYWWMDIVQVRADRAIVSCPGHIRTLGINLAQRFGARMLISIQQGLTFAPPKYSFLGFGYSPMTTGEWITIPDWFPVLLTATLAATPWIHWSKRFSLRTLLIATTLVAVVLGLAVYIVSK
jgi:hypothetical protein